MLVKKHNQKILTAIAIVCVFVFGFFAVQDVLAQVDTGLEEVGEATGLGTTDPRIIAGRIIQYFLGFLGVIALGIIVYAGFLYMTSGGEEEKTSKARKYIINAVIGLIIILSAFAITSYITNSLLEATEAGDFDGTDGGNGGLTIFGQKKLTAKIIPSGDLSTYNFAVKIKFNYPLTTQSIANLGNNIKVEQIREDGSGAGISGDVIMLDNNKIAEFRSDEGCPDECNADFCFAKDSDFRVTIKPNVVKSTETDNDGNNLVLTCSGLGECEEEFHTGTSCDTRVPNLTIQAPGYNSYVCQGNEMQVAVSATDNLGLGMLFYQIDPGSVNSLEEADPDDTEVLSGAPLEHTSYFVWPNSGSAELGEHYLGAGVADLSNNFNFKRKRFNIVPTDCCDEDGEIICNSENPACPGCGGAGCTDDFDCVSGICYEGECVAWPVINNLSPSQGAPGNLVQITGDRFGVYDSTTSRVYFSCASGAGCTDGYIPADLGCNNAFSWGSGQVIAQVPQNAITGPIKLVNNLGQFDDTENERGWVGNFIVNPSLENPGLCFVSRQNCNLATEDCSKGEPGNLVNLMGIYFGDSKDADDGVYFGEYSGSLTSSGSWNDTQISEIKIPNLESSYVNVTIGKGERCLTEICESTTACAEGEPDCIDGFKTTPCYDSRGVETCVCYYGDACTKGEEHCVCREVYSNPYRFHIDRPLNLPEITEISPDSAPAYQIITIKGKNFGTSAGRVEFIDGENVIASELACGSDLSWSDVQVTAVVPEELRLQSDTREILVRLTTSNNLPSNEYSYTINSEAPAPGICALRPNNGPVGTAVDIIGQGFGAEDDYSIMFYNQVETDTFAEGHSWTDELIGKVLVPSGATSGGLSLQSDSVVSNDVFFRVGSCTPDSCAEDETCCPNGVCAAECEQEEVYADSEFAWIVSTGPLPRIPRVLERNCDPEFGLSASPLPIPSLRNACVNGEIGATFNMQMDQSSFNVSDAGQKVVIKRCIDQPQEGQAFASCDLDLCCEAGNSRSECENEEGSYLENCVKVGVDASSELTWTENNLNIVCTDTEEKTCARGSKNCTCTASTRVDMFTVDLSLDKFNPLLANDNNELFANSWYQVEILGGPGGVKEGETVNEEQRYFMPRTYKWQFKTGTVPCVPSELMITPGKGLIEEVNEMQIYKAYGLYECQLIEMANFNGNWSVVEETTGSERAELYGYMCPSAGDLAPCEDGADARKDYGVFWISRDAVDSSTGQIKQFLSYDIETPANDFVKIQAQGNLPGTTSNLTDQSLLEIKFVEPKVVNFYPDCLGACINASIGADFNTRMNYDSFDNAFEVLPCSDGDCLSYDYAENIAQNYDYAYSIDQQGNTINRLTINLSANLDPNKFYRVILRDSISSASGKKLTNLNYSKAGAPAFDCADYVDNDEDGTIDYSGGYDKEEKGQTGYGTLDFVCGCYEEDEGDSSTGEFVSYGKNPGAKICISPAYFACRDLNENSIIRGEADLIEEVFGYKYLAPDNSCESADSWEQGIEAELDAFSWVFKTKDDDQECKLNRVEVNPTEFIATETGQKIQYAATPYSTPDECSAQGQALNPLQYNWQWSSSQTDIASITNTNYNPGLPEYCSANCLATGSNPLGAVCGDGEIEASLGEECDDSNIVDGDGCSSVCLLEPFANCISDSVLNCCGNGVKEGEEECDQGCDWEYDDGEACTPSADDPKCICRARGTVCTAGCLNAGSGKGFACKNGSLDPGEDRDSGVQLSSNCLNLGAKYQINADGTIPAVCGNGVVETGEECEPSGRDPYCTEKCVWRGFNRCNTTDKVCHEYPNVSCTEDFYSDFDLNGTKDFCTCMDFEYQHPDLYPCCGDGVQSDYNGVGETDEECEAECTLENGDPCGFGSDGCECNMPDGCSTTCIHEGSSYAYNSFCGNGIVEAGEDEICEAVAETFGSPYQTATINSNIYDLISDNICLESVCLFNFDLATLLTQGITRISAKTSEPNQSLVSGSADLTFQTEQCLYPEVRLSNSQPEDGEDNVCRNALITVNFDSKVQTASFSRENIKLYKKLEEGESCPGEYPVPSKKWSLEENQGSLAMDEYGTNNLIIVNGQWTEGRQGSGLSLESTGIEMQERSFLMNNSPVTDFNVSASWSVAMWVKPTDFERSVNLFFAKNNEDDYEQASYVSLSFTPSAYRFQRLNLTDEATATIDSDLTNNSDEWVHLIYSYDAASQEAIIYRNGEAQGTADWDVGDISIDEIKFGIIDFVERSNTFFKGTIDEIMMFGQAFDDAQAAALYNSYEVLAYNNNNLSWPDKIVSTIKSALNKVKIFARNSLVKVGWAQAEPAWCQVGVVYDVLENELHNSSLLITPAQLMEPSRDYKLEFTNLRNVCNAQSTATVEFTTREEICRITDVAIEPADVFLTRSNEFSAEPYTATAMYHDQPIQGIDSVYDWTWDWESTDSSIAGIASTDENGNSDDPQNAQVNSYNKNGNTLIKAELTVTVDTEEGQAGLRRAGYGNLEVFLCENLWSPTPIGTDFSMWGASQTYPTHLWHGGESSSANPATNIGLFYCRDAGESVQKTCYNGQPCNFDGDCVGIGDQQCTAPQVCQDGITSCETDSDCAGIGNGKCLDQGEHDDLPKLKVVYGTSATSTSNQCRDEIDNDNDLRADAEVTGVRNDAGELVYPKDPKCLDNQDLWEMPKLLSQYFFTRDPGDDLDDGSSDIISLRVYENPEALSPELWYMRYAPNPGNLASADFDCLSNDQGEYCYHGGRDGNTVYISAANLGDAQLYNNIVVLGYNEGANIATQNIFSQMLETMKYNLNLADDTAAYDKKLTFRKDLERMQNVALIRKFIDIYQTLNNGQVPQLESGTYLRNQTFSVWPSWQDELGRALGVTLPSDPENHFQWVEAVAGGLGEVCGEAVVDDNPVPLKCPEINQQCIMPNYYCSTCPPGWDKETCYSSSVVGTDIPNFAQSYSIPVDHPVYHYEAQGPRDYKFEFRLEGVAKDYYQSIYSVPNVPKRCTHNGVACSTDNDCGTGGSCHYVYD